MLPIIIPSVMIGSELIKREIITDTTRGIYNIMSGIYGYNIPKINEIIEELDIKKKIELIDIIFDTYSEKLIGDNILVLTLNNLHDISLKIKNELEEIKKDIEIYKNLYFSYFRSKPYLNKLENLKLHCKIMNERLDLFTKLK